MLENGFVKLHRSILNWEWYDDANTMRLFLHLLLTANHADASWHGVAVKRGQRITSYANLADDLHLSVRQVRTSLNKLKTTGEVTSESTSQFTLITIAKYDFYQDVPTTSDKPNDKQQVTLATSKRQASDKQATSKRQQRKNEKNNKNEKKEKNNPTRVSDSDPEDITLMIAGHCAGSPEYHQALREFADMRTELKKPLTPRALRMLIKKLCAYDINTRIAMLEESVMHSWQGVFEIKSNARPKTALPSTSPPPIDPSINPYR